MHFAAFLMGNPFIFVHIQKTGGTSIRALLKIPPPFVSKHLTALELRSLYGAEEWNRKFKFSFVRNPWDRLVSWWSHIDSMRPRLGTGGNLNQFQRMVLVRARSFEEFLTNCDVEICELDGRKHIFRNQIDYLSDSTGKVIVDFVGRFENFQDDFAFIARRLGVDHGTMARLNASPRKHYRYYYNNDLVNLVSDKYARDIDAFGYSFNSPEATVSQSG